jgi:hypothetical protein
MMRYRLVTLVTVVTFAASFFGTVHWLVVEPTLRREHAIAAIRELGGQVDYASPPMTPLPGMGNTVFKREFRDAPEVIGPDWAVGVLGERYFLSPVRRVDYLRNTRPLMEQDLAILKDLPCLEMVDFTHHGKPSGLQGNIGCPEITDAAVPHIIKLTDLQFLLLTNSQVTDKGVVTLCENLPKLKLITLTGTRISDVSLTSLAKLPDLKYLDVQRTNVTKASVRRFDRARREVVFVQDVDDSIVWHLKN